MSGEAGSSTTQLNKKIGSHIKTNIRGIGLNNQGMPSGTRIQGGSIKT